MEGYCYLFNKRENHFVPICVYICILMEEMNLNYRKMFIKIHCNSHAILFFFFLITSYLALRCPLPKIDKCIWTSERSKAVPQSILRDWAVFSHLCVKIDLHI